MKIAFIRIIAQNTIFFRKNMILALEEKNHEVFVFCIDFINDSKKQIENLGTVTVDYSLNLTGLNPFKDIKNIVDYKILLRLLIKSFRKEFN